MRRVALAAAGALAAIALVALGFLAEAHWEIRKVAPALPTAAALRAVGQGGDGPVRVRYVNTASQRGMHPGGGTYGGFVLEWPDGRAFAIDVGMTREGAVAFGRALEWLVGADPAAPHGSLAEQLGDAVHRIDAVAFTHLHVDHTEGMAALCAARGAPVRVHQTPDQHARHNYTTTPGLADVDEAGCAERAPLTPGDGALFALPGFPGLAAFAVGGHTPGSTGFVARVGDTFWLFAGDVSNELANLKGDVPKPLLYSWLVTPEDRARLRVARRFFAALDAEPDVNVVVAHDLGAIVASGMEVVGGDR